MRPTWIQLSVPTLAAALMLSPHLCGAQSTNSCPVEIRHAKFQTVVLGSWAHNQRTKVISLQYQNATSEEIAEVVFNTFAYYREHGAIGQSLVNNAIRTPVAATLQPGKWKKAEIDIGDSEFRQMQVALTEMTFTSGRHWTNPNTNACVWRIQP
jgi:hypothetical protein